MLIDVDDYLRKCHLFIKDDLPPIKQLMFSSVFFVENGAQRGYQES